MRKTHQPPSRPFQREVLLFVAGGFAFLLALSVLALAAFRGATRWGNSEARGRLVAEARGAAASLAGSPRAATELATGSRTAALLLRARALQASLYGVDGLQVAEAGYLPGAGRSPGRLAEAERPADDPVVSMAGPEGADAVVSVELPSREVLRVTFDGSRLAESLRNERILTVVVAVGGLALLVLVVPFLRRLMRPIDALEETARGADAVVPPAREGAGEGARPRGNEADEAVDTFRRTIVELRLRTGELETLRRTEQERADALAVTAGTLVRSHPGGVLVVGASGTLSEANAPALAMLSLSRADLGRPASEAFRDWPVAAAAVERAAGGEATAGIELFASEATSSRVLGLTVVPVVAPEGLRLGTLVFLEDRTTTRRMEKELSRRRELAALGEMSAGIAHEFRNATGTLLGWARLAAAAGDDASRDKALAAVRAEAEHVSRVTGDFLLFARPERLAPGPVDLLALASEVAAEERMAAPGLAIEARGAACPLEGDAALLRRALVNLVRNAREAAAAGGREGRVLVTVAVSAAGGEPGRAAAGGRLARVTVEDDGPGIPPESEERIFVPFFSTKDSGTGLGLPLVAKIAALHGGSVETGRSPDLKGALFVLSLPVA